MSFYYFILLNLCVHHLLELCVLQGEIVFEVQSKKAIMLGPDVRRRDESKYGILSDNDCFYVELQLM